MSGELLDIAYQALATRPEERPASVQKFQEALRLYQSHAESILLADSAQDKMEQAGREGNYECYSQALFAFQEALAIWDGNVRAQTGAENARLRATRSVPTTKGDLDLGLSLLDPANCTPCPSVRKTAGSAEERETRVQRLRRLKRLVGGLAVASIVILTVSLVWIRTQKQQVENQATELRGAYELLASNQKQLFAEKERALQSESDALSAKQVADEQKAAAEQQKQVAEQQTRVAEEQRGLADAASYVAQIGLAAERITNNAFLDATRLLDAHATPRFASRRNWEWAYLHHLCHLDLRTWDMSEHVQCLAVLPDGRGLLVGLDDGTVRVQDLRSGEEWSRLSHGAAVYALAVSGDGRYVATGGEGAGVIKIWRLADDGRAVDART